MINLQPILKLFSLSLTGNMSLTKIPPNNVYNEFLRIFLDLYNEAFPKKKIKIKRKIVNSPWMTKRLVKSSKKKQGLYERFLRDKNPEKELNYKQYKTLFESLKKKSKKTIIKILLIHTNIISKKRGML